MYVYFLDARILYKETTLIFQAIALSLYFCLNVRVRVPVSQSFVLIQMYLNLSNMILTL